MDFSALAKVEEITSDQIAQYHLDAELSYLKALALIRQASRTRFRDKQALSRSMKLFLHSISLQRNRVESYIWIAYILFIVGDLKLSKKYFATAEKLDAKHIFVQDFRLILFPEERDFQLMNI